MKHRLNIVKYSKLFVWLMFLALLGLMSRPLNTQAALSNITNTGNSSQITPGSVKEDYKELSPINDTNQITPDSFEEGHDDRPPVVPPPASVSPMVSSDAIAIRVFNNDSYLSPYEWYNRNIGAKRSLQSLIVDGYDAVRDDRTIYVAASNVISPDGNKAQPQQYSRLQPIIVIISFNQNISSETLDILGQILNNWHFNQNIKDFDGTCWTKPGAVTGVNCLNTKDCPSGQYCNSFKAKVVRDTRRLIDLASIKAKLEQYRTTYNHYPSLEAGTYLTNKTLSVWPSWQKVLAIKLNSPLPVDPINKLGECPAGYNPETCWNEQQRNFATTWPDLPDGSRSYQYEYIDNTNYILCANFESSCSNLNNLSCSGTTVNHGPVIECSALRGISQQKFTGYASIADPEDDPINNIVTITSESPMTGWQPLSAELVNNRQQIKISSAKAGNAGRYTITLTAKDGLNNSTTQTCAIIISDPCMSTFTINYSAGLQGSIVGSTTQSVCRGGDGLEVTAVADPNYTFVKWSNNATNNPRHETNVTHNISLTAEFAPESYTITFNPQGGTVSPTTKIVTYNAPVGPLPTPTKTGFSFVHWNTMANDSGTTYDDTTIYHQATNITLYAIWSNASYTLDYQVDNDVGGTINGISHQTVLHGHDGTAVTAVPSQDYVFDKWSDNLATPQRQETNVTDNISVTARFIYNPFVCGDSSVTDVDGNSYATVEIGNQCWFKENLKTTNYRDGAPIKNITDCGEWIQYTLAGYAWYNNDPANKDIYGALYNRKAVENNDHPALCPTGWHVPSMEEFLTLRVNVGPNNANALKATGTDPAYWYYNTDTEPNNSSGFSARGAGDRYSSSGGFENIQKGAYFWTSTGGEAYGMPTAHALYLTSNYNNIYVTATTSFENEVGFAGAYGFSVRCIKD